MKKMVGPTHHLSSLELQQFNSTIPIEEQPKYLRKLGAHITELSAATSVEEYQKIINSIFPGVPSTVIDQLAHLAIHMAAATGNNPTAQGIQDSIEQIEGATPSVIATPSESAPPPSQPALPPSDPKALARCKEAQLWVVNVAAIELFVVMNQIISDLAKMRKDWNTKMVQIKSLMLDMAKEMYQISKDAGLARYAAAWLEIGSLIAEGVLGIVSFAIQATTFGLQKMEEAKSTKSTIQDLDNQLDAEINKPRGATYAATKAEATRLQGEMDSAKTALKDANAMPQTNPVEIKARNDAIETRSRELRQAKYDLTAYVTGSTKPPGDKLALIEHRLKNSVEDKDAMGIVDETTMSKKHEEIRTKYSPITSMGTTLTNAITSLTKAGFQVGKAGAELSASNLEALSKYLSQIYQALQETSSSTMQATQDAITKQIDGLLDLLKSVQAIQSQR